MGETPHTPFRNVLASILLGVGVGIAGTFVGLKVMGIPLEPGFNSPGFHKFMTAYSELENHYFQHESDDTLLNGAIDGMTKSLNDPFTDYFPPANAKEFQNMLSSSYVGIGATIQQAGSDFVIYAVTKNAPAEKSGIKPKDVIVKIDGKSVQGLTLDQLSSRILGPEGSQVTVTVKRAGMEHPLDFQLTRAKIEKQTVFSKMIDNHTGYIQITVVADNTSQEVQTQLQDLKKAGAKSIIVDLRGNPGGYLEEAVKIASQFIPKGKVVVETVERDSSLKKMYSNGPGVQIPVVVLMDENTASAAEILASALHEDIGAPLIGTKSYGKGTMQETTSFRDGSSLKYTVGKWLTPDGEWIHKKGLEPTVPVNLPDYSTLPPLDVQKLPLHSDENDPVVEVLQKMLKALGYSVSRTDGYYDASTATAVKQFQQKADLPTTGIVDKTTSAKLWDEFSQLLTTSDTQLNKAEQVAESKTK